MHSTLLTDLPADPEVDALPGYFDQAFGQWCDYFGVEAAEHADWHVRIYLMKRRDHFAAAGMIPHDLPAFLGGYTRGGEIWLDEQPGDVLSPAFDAARRHARLLPRCMAGGLGPPWFAEAVAELLATHRLQRGHDRAQDGFPIAATTCPVGAASKSCRTITPRVGR